MSRRWFSVLVLAATSPALFGCEDTGKISADHAKNHATMLVTTATADVEEIRRGLPEGAKLLASLYAEGTPPPKDDRQGVRDALARARNRVQDLRVAKATFFTLIDADGTVLRNDQDQDLMADRDAFKAFPELRNVLPGGKYLETRGFMEEARGVAKPRADGQWVAAAPVQGKEGKGIYAAGWAWSSYAYRLEFKLRGEIRAELLREADSRKNEALAYVYLLVGKDVYGAPVSPETSMDTLAKLDLQAKVQGEAAYGEALEITGRSFGLGAKRAPALGADVIVAVLRSET